MSNQLLPCPFDGETLRILDRGGKFEARYAIGCDNLDCPLWIPDDVDLVQLHNYAICYVDLEDAVKCYNARPSCDSKHD